MEFRYLPAAAAFFLIFSVIASVPVVCFLRRLLDGFYLLNVVMRVLIDLLYRSVIGYPRKSMFPVILSLWLS